MSSYVLETFRKAIKALLSSSVTGLWTGLTICVLMQSIFFIAFVFKLDWKKAAEEVRTYIP